MIRKKSLNQVAVNIEQVAGYLGDNIGPTQKHHDRLWEAVAALNNVVEEIRAVAKETK